MHPLDRPAWTALATLQNRLALGDDRARRFPLDIGPLAAARDHGDDAREALAALIPDGDDISLLEVDPPEPPLGFECAFAAPCLQMHLDALAAGVSSAPEITALTDADADDMLTLATLTRPGPFRARTHTLGRFLGVRRAGRLIAMAGERMCADGFIEISAVCTHPDHRGEGLGEALVRAACARILREGATPFLHCYETNANAIALYERLGFRTRVSVTHAVWKAAPSA